MIQHEAIPNLTAKQLLAALTQKEINVSNILAALKSRIERLDKTFHAWVSIDWAEASRVARQMDGGVRAGSRLSPLHGIPIGFKDIYAVAGMVTTFGAKPFAHERPDTDAAAVAAVRAAGAIILGKTATTEFAFLDPAETRNPWNPAHTPGGSSSGSAVAVALSMVPLALGSQTLGSVLRPAAYCGVIGFKPSYGKISLHGVLPVAPSLDHAGIFARTVEDVTLAFHVLESRQATESLQPGQDSQVKDHESTSFSPLIGIPRRYFFDEASPEIAAHVEQVAGTFARAGATIEEVQLPPSFDRIHEAGLKILKAEAATYHWPQFSSHRANYRPRIRELLDQGILLPAVDYVRAQCDRAQFAEESACLLRKHDALLMPVTPSPAPRGLESTGDPRFCAPWTFVGVPAISLPSGLSRDGLPLAIQLVGARDRDDSLLSLAAWVEKEIGFATRAPEIW